MNVRDLVPLDEGGLIFIDYNYLNTSTAYCDQFGNEVSQFEIDRDGINTVIDLTPQINGYTNVPVLYFASNFKIFGAKYMASVNP